MQGEVFNFFEDPNVRQSVLSIEGNNAAGGHLEKHIWTDASKGNYGKGTNYFIKIPDVRNCLDSASIVVSKSKASFEKKSENRYEI